jgi:hypothetical protein
MSHAAVSRVLGILRHPHGVVPPRQSALESTKWLLGLLLELAATLPQAVSRQDLHGSLTVVPQDFPGINSLRTCFYLVRIIRAANR